MADAWHHAVSSAKKYGGEPEDYIDIHYWFDETKAHFADPRHRAIRHHSQGIAWAIEHFGQTITISTGKKIPVRWIGEQHVLEDFGRIPTMADFLREMKIEKWMVRGAKPLSRELGEDAEYLKARVEEAKERGDEVDEKRFTQRLSEVIVSDHGYPFSVGRVDGTGPVLGFPSVGAAENYVATYLTANDPDGVEAGKYYIDGPEEQKVIGHVYTVKFVRYMDDYEEGDDLTLRIQLAREIQQAMDEAGVPAGEVRALYSYEEANDILGCKPLPAGGAK